MDKSEIYCPICQKVLVAENKKEVEKGEHRSYVFVHDEVPHADSDIDALESGIN